MLIWCPTLCCGLFVFILIDFNIVFWCILLFQSLNYHSGFDASGYEKLSQGYLSYPILYHCDVFVVLDRCECDSSECRLFVGLSPSHEVNI